MNTPHSVMDLDALRDEFLSLLQSADEYAVQSFLCSFIDILRAISPWYDDAFKEFQLGSDHRADFLLLDYGFDMNRSAASITLVELESPKHKLFNKAGDTTKELTHAIRQIRDWRAWIREHRSYFVEQIGKYSKNRFPRSWGSIENYTIVIGRRSDLAPTQREKLRAVVQEDRYSIMTYDTLIERYRNLILRH